MRALTDRQQQCLDLIRDSIARRGYAPTLREIGEAMGIRSTNGVNDHLDALERKNRIRRDHMRSRAIVVVADQETGRIETPFTLPTPGTFIQRRRCLRCATTTFLDTCRACHGSLMEVA